MMNPEHHRRVDDLFAAASVLATEARARFVADQCGDDQALKDEVLSLLASDNLVGDFLQQPALGDGFHVVDVDDKSRVGDLLGSYRIVRLIDSGGMGAVYVAHRADDEFEKSVAIKLMRPNMVTDDTLQRFLRERQTLALLDHPNVARLLDGGTTPDGQPYLVMEYIDGEAIDRWCNSRNSTVDERLRLFQAVCAGVSHAHRNLIVHRDIKPTNILVLEEDGRGVPKLLDFGIAKILEPNPGITATHQRLLTPEYASPEQIKGEKISVASDVYSLGVVLFELLTRTKPFAGETCSSRELERRICEQDAPKPSTVEVNRPSVRRRLAGDLDNIVLKALRKSPERRYATVDQLATDVQRHLDGLPVIARRSSVLYLSSRFIRRHRSAVAVTVLVLVTALTGIVWDARLSRQKAEVADNGRKMLADLLGSFHVFTQGSTAIEEKAESLIRSLESRPEEKAEFLETIARVWEESGLHTRSIRWRREALQLRQQKLAFEPLKSVRSMHDLGKALLSAGRARAAHDLLREANEYLGSNKVDAELIATNMSSLALAKSELGDPIAATALFIDALAAAAEIGSDEAVVGILLDVAQHQVAQGDTRGAMRHLERAEQIVTSDSFTHWRLRARVLQRIGLTCWTSPRFSDAETYLRRAIDELHPQVQRGDSQYAGIRLDLAVVLSYRIPRTVAVGIGLRALTQIERAQGPDSASFADACLKLARLEASGFSDTASICADTAAHFWQDAPPLKRATVEESLGVLLTRQTSVRDADFRRAETHISTALDLRQEYAATHWKTLSTRSTLSWLKARTGRSDETESLALQNCQDLETLLSASHPLVVAAWRRIVKLYEGFGDVEKARDIEQHCAPGWPYYPHIAVDDGTAERSVNIEYDDDYLEKTIWIPDDPSASPRATLWLYGRPFHWSVDHLTAVDDFHLLVNGDLKQVKSFNLGALFSFEADHSVGAISRKTATVKGFFWVPIEIPVSWLRSGRNRFLIYEDFDYGTKRGFPRAWEYNNLQIGIDTSSSDKGCSWWYSAFDLEGVTMAAIFDPGRRPGWHSGKTTLERLTEALTIPPAIVQEARRKAIESCKGELMIRLELRPSR